MVRAVLFDLDDTLFDHRESAADALRAVHGAHQALRTTPFDMFERQHACLLEEFHPEVVSGRLGMDAAREERFRRLFQYCGHTASDAACREAAILYRSEYLAARRPMAGAVALVEAVRRRASVAIVSNNMMQEQQDKLAHCGLAAYVDALVVSEDVGTAKPDPAIFLAALRSLRVLPAEAVMVGDSWTADVAGARSAGIRPVWFNPLRLPSPEPGAAVQQLHAFEPAAAVVALLLDGEWGRRRLKADTTMAPCPREGRHAVGRSVRL